MHIHHEAEVVHAHLGKALVAQNAGVVDQYVHTAPGVDGLLHHGLHRCKVGHRGRIGQGLAACSTNLIHHLLRRACCTTAAIHGTTQVIDQHFGAAGRQGQRMLAPQATARTRHDGYAAFEFDVCHEKTLLYLKRGEWGKCQDKNSWQHCTATPAAASLRRGQKAVHGLSLTALDKHVDKWGKVLYGTAK